jgi:hypothetical protein
LIFSFIETSSWVLFGSYDGEKQPAQQLQATIPVALRESFQEPVVSESQVHLTPLLSMHHYLLLLKTMHHGYPA